MGSKREVFVTTFIDVDLWNSAGWSATAFLYDIDGKMPPSIGLVFKDGDAGRRIFTGLRTRLGVVDRFEELHVSIIEGEIPGEPPGYTVHVGTRLEGIQKRAKAQGVELKPETVVMISRLNRMNPQPGSPHLSTFKGQFEKFNRYIVLPVTMGAGGAEPQFDLGIEKRMVNFKQAVQIGPNDIDVIAIKKRKA